jgi:hypothetical protein
MAGFRIGMGLAPWMLSPIAPMRWEHNAETSESVAVYYAPALPSISVLHRGRDAVCNAMLGFVGFSQLKLPGGSIVEGSSRTSRRDRSSVSDVNQSIRIPGWAIRRLMRRVFRT